LNIFQKIRKKNLSRVNFITSSETIGIRLKLIVDSNSGWKVSLRNTLVIGF